ncbi:MULTISPECIES: hypothetical protein [Haloferax]|uniref:hypothetical protein n=1 Tax=Haloferax TaxID=2251 RepID=UPI001784B829|nr:MULTISPECIES: hypothetical protein [Haloferax]
MVHLRTILAVTAVAHALLAWLVSLDARKRGDDAGQWVAKTLLTGVFGAVDYVRNGR